MLSLLKESKVTLSSGAVAAGTTTVDGSVIDMAAGNGFDAAAAILSLGDVADTSVITLSWRESANSDGSSSTEVTGSSVAFTAGASTADSKLMISDCARRTQRYIFPRVARATANAPINSVISVLYKAKSIPVTQGSDVIASVLSAA